MQTKIYSTMGILLATWFALACSRGVSKSELQAYVNDPDNGLIQSDSIGAFRVSASLVPSDLLALTQYEGLVRLDSNINADSIAVSYEQYCFFWSGCQLRTKSQFISLVIASTQE